MSCRIRVSGYPYDKQGQVVLVTCAFGEGCDALHDRIPNRFRRPAEPRAHDIDQPILTIDFCLWANSPYAVDSEIEAVKQHYVPELGEELERLQAEKERILFGLNPEEVPEVPQVTVDQVRERLEDLIGLLNRDARSARAELKKIIPEMIVHPGEDGSCADGSVYLSVEGLVEAGCASSPLVGAYDVGGGTPPRALYGFSCESEC